MSSWLILTSRIRQQTHLLYTKECYSSDLEPALNSNRTLYKSSFWSGEHPVLNSAPWLGAEAMAFITYILEELSGRKHHPEPHKSPDLNLELTWAWAMDKFEYLSHRSCQNPWYFCPGKPSIATLLEEAAFGDERGQKRCREPHVEEPKDETMESLWGPQEVGTTSRKRVHWALNQSEDDHTHSGLEMLAPSESLSQEGSQKRHKTEVYMTEEPGKDRHPSIVDSRHLEILQSTPQGVPEKHGARPSCCL